MEAPSAIGKITISNLGCIPAASVVEGQSSPIAQIYGIANGIKSVVDKNRGEVYEAITGSFEGVNTKTRRVYQSGVLYLPSGIHGLLEAAVKGQFHEEVRSESGEVTRKAHYDFNDVRFALEVSVVKAKNPAGYSYEAKSLIPAVKDDPMSAIREAIAASAQKTIESPKPKK
jgi:hypothetical protein